MGALLAPLATRNQHLHLPTTGSEILSFIIYQVEMTHR